jgi:hypothetical protein
VTKIDPKAIPRDAMRFAMPATMKFADVSDSTDVRPFSMLARSKAPVDHYYWGRIVHDFAGMQWREQGITIDYTHDFDAVLGYANQFAITDAGLELSGALVVVETGDKADEVSKKGKAGVPYESSIDWFGPDVELEYIPDGVSTSVNDMQFSGPGYVVRKWPLRAASICRYGVDRDTHTQFSETQSEAETVSVSITTSSTETDEVSKTVTAPAAGATAPAETQQFAQGGGRSETAPQQGHISIEMLKQFSAEFGPKGTEFLTAGLSIDAARYQFAIHERDAAREELKQFAVTVTAKDTEIADLKAKLMQFSKDALGQDTPVGTDGKPAEKSKLDEKTAQFAEKTTAGRAGFAAGLKLKGT